MPTSKSESTTRLPCSKASASSPSVASILDCNVECVTRPTHKCIQHPIQSKLRLLKLINSFVIWQSDSWCCTGAKQALPKMSPNALKEKQGEGTLGAESFQWIAMIRCPTKLHSRSIIGIYFKAFFCFILLCGLGSAHSREGSGVRVFHHRSRR